MKVVLIKQGGGVGQEVGDIGTITEKHDNSDHLWFADFRYGGASVNWLVHEDQIKPCLDVTETLKSLKKCLKSEI